MDAYLEFLSENSDRRYPLREDCSALSVSAVEWPDGVILDARGFSRDNPSLSYVLVAYSGANSSGDAQWNPLEGHSALFCRMGKNCMLRIDVPVGVLSFPYTVEARAPDPHTSMSLAGLTVSLGEAWGALDDTQRYIFGENAPWEDGVIVDLYRQQVDELRVLHQDGSHETVEGDVSLRGGYGVSITQSQNTVEINAAPGQGELGEYPGPGVGDICRSLIRTLTGVQPNAAGHFYFLPGPGVKIVSLPNKIQIVADPSYLTPAGSCS